MLKKIRDFMDEEKGQGMAEYGLILAGIAVVVIVAINALGGQITNKLNDVKNALQ